MKKKTPPAADPVVPNEMLERAKQSVRTDASVPPRRTACVVCGGESAPTSNEGLCWVCRRLKISAWREAELQMPAQD